MSVARPVMTRRALLQLAMVCVAASALVVAGASIGWAVAGTNGTAGGGGVALAVIYALGLKIVMSRMTVLVAEQRATVDLRPLVGPLPLPLGGWAIDPVVAERLVREVMVRQPEFALEFGAGASTILIAATLRQLRHGKLLSVEHEERFADVTRTQLRSFGLSEWADVVVAPLTAQATDSGEWSWYDRSFEARIGQPVEFLFVDGPPAVTSRARYPALPVMKKHLAADCVVLLDDGKRPDERWIARAWEAELRGSAEFVESSKGAWIIRL